MRRSTRFLQNFENKVRQISEQSQDSDQEEIRLDLAQDVTHNDKRHLRNQLEDLAHKHNPFSLSPRSRPALSPGQVQKVSRVLYDSSKGGSPEIRRSVYVRRA